MIASARWPAYLLDMDGSEDHEQAREKLGKKWLIPRRHGDGSVISTQAYSAASLLLLLLAYEAFGARKG